VLIAVGAGAIVGGITRPADPLDGTPMDIEWLDDHGYATLGEGDILRLTVDGNRVDGRVVAEGLRFPRGIAVLNDTLYVAELGELPCENPVPRCKGENLSNDAAEGERQLLASNSGRVLAYPIADGGLGEPSVVVDGLHFTNTDHGLNDLEAGPDGMLYLAVGNLDQLAWDDGGNPPDPSVTERIGSVLRIDPATGAVEVFATGVRNVYGLDFDASGTLWGVDNDGRGHDIWRFEELLRIGQGLDYGFPDDGTVGPYQRRTGFASWIMPTGAGSGGIHVEEDVVISGACGRITRVNLADGGGDAAEQQVQRSGCVTAIERLPDGRLILGTVMGDQAFAVVADGDLFP
jgi:Glucose / Sorbosone dehydrogenase